MHAYTCTVFSITILHSVEVHTSTLVYVCCIIILSPPFCPQVGGLLLPNDGMCHLELNEEGFYEYIRDPEQVGKCVYSIYTYMYMYILPTGFPIYLPSAAEAH